MDDSFYTYLSLLLAPISSAVTWWVARRKRKAEETDALDKTVNALTKRIHELTINIMDLQRDNMALQRDVARLISILTPQQILQYQQLKRNEEGGTEN